MPQRVRPFVGVYVRQNQTMTRDIFPVLEHYGYRFRGLDPDDLRGLEPGSVDVLLFPGGWYLFVNEEALQKHADIAARIRSFVEAGGGYVGVCCGAINACYLGLLNADLVKMLGIGPTPIEPVDGKHPVLKGVVKKSKVKWRQWERIDMLRYNGWPMLLRDGAHMIAAYDLDKKVAAIAAARYGCGRVVAFSPHPEGATCAPGVFRDRDRQPVVYDGIAMNTARMLDNALRWCSEPARR